MSEDAIVETVELVPIDPPKLPLPRLPWYHSAALRERLIEFKWYFVFVIVPTVLALIYFGAIAADRYEAEARFVVKSTGVSRGAGISNLFQGMGASADDAAVAQTYITSRDATQQLVAKADLINRLGEPTFDIIWRFPNPFGSDTREDLWRHFQWFVNIEFDKDSSITTLKVQAFRPKDAQDLAEALLADSEALINRMGERMRREAVRAASLEVDRSLALTHDALKKLNEFRKKNAMIDPERMSSAAIQTITSLALQIARSRAELGELKLSSPNSPQVNTLNERISAYEQQIAEERARLAGTDTSLAPLMSEYDRLRLERQFAERTFAAAETALNMARLESERQRLFVERISQPNLPDYPKYPYRLLNILIVFIASNALYSIGKHLIRDTLSHAEQ